MNIHLNSPIGGTGYGVASYNILKALNEQPDVEMALSIIGHPHVDDQAAVDLVQQAMTRANSVDYKAPTLKIWHQFDLLNKPGKGKYFALPFYEVDVLDDKEKHHLGFPDQLIVSSKWAKNVLKENGIKKRATVVPMGVDTNIFHPVETKVDKGDKYIFMTVGKWEVRKGHDTIIDCFNQAFTEEDNVELWMATHNGFLNEQQTNEWTNKVQTSKLASKIRMFPRLPTHAKIAELMSYSDCGLYPSRGEGWNLELLEHMAMGKPVIATNWSAHTEFCNKKNARLIDIDEKEPANDGMWFHGKSNWAKIGQNQIDQLIAHMQDVYNNAVVDNPAGLETAKKFSWKNTAENLLRCIS
jgi:glycosyltransferase involved in cell wall biosynthesis